MRETLLSAPRSAGSAATTNFLSTIFGGTIASTGGHRISGNNPYSNGLIVWGTLNNSILGISSSGNTASGYFRSQATTAVLNAQAGIDQLTGTQRRFNMKLLMEFSFEITTVARYWVGLSSVGLATTLASDSPAASLAALRFSTNVPDTNFILAVKDGTTINTFDTTIAVDTSVHYLLIEIDDSIPNVKMQLFNTSFISEASNTFTTNLPAQTTDMFIQYGIQTLEGVAKTIDFYGFISQQFRNL